MCNQESVKQLEVLQVEGAGFDPSPEMNQAALLTPYSFTKAESRGIEGIVSRMRSSSPT